MTGFYEGLAQTALSLIAQFGRKVTIIRTDVATHDPITGVVTTNTLSKEVDGIVLPLGPDDNDLKGDNLTAKKVRKLIIAESPFDPETGDLVCFDNSEWQVMRCQPINPAGTNIVYKMGIMQ